MGRFDTRRAVLCGFVSGKENCSPRGFGVSLEHVQPSYRWLMNAFTAMARGSFPRGIMVSSDGGSGDSRPPLRSIKDTTEKVPPPVWTTHNSNLMGEGANISGRQPRPAEPVQLTMWLV